MLSKTLFAFFSLSKAFAIVLKASIFCLSPSKLFNDNVGAILFNSLLIPLCLLLSAIIKSGFNLLISSKFGCLRVPTEV